MTTVKGFISYLERKVLFLKDQNCYETFVTFNDVEQIGNKRKYDGNANENVS